MVHMGSARPRIILKRYKSTHVTDLEQTPTLEQNIICESLGLKKKYKIFTELLDTHPSPHHHHPPTTRAHFVRAYKQ